MRLERHVLRELLLNLAIAASVVYFVVGLSGLLQASLARGFPLITAMRYLPFALLPYMEILTPLAFLLAVMFTYGRLSADNEFTATQACGVHPMRMLSPMLLTGVLLAGMQWSITSYVIPRVWVERSIFMSKLLEEALHHIEKGRNEYESPDGRFFMGWAAQEGSRFDDLYLRFRESREDKGSRFEGRADRAFIQINTERILMQLEGFQPFTKDWQVTTRNFTIQYSLSQFAEAEGLPDKADFYASDLLVMDWIRCSKRIEQNKQSPGSVPPERVARDYRMVRRSEFILNRRVAFSLINLLYGIIGAPIAIWMRRGTRLAALSIGIAVFFLGFAIGKAGDGIEGSMKGAAWLNGWLAALALGVAAAAALWKLVRR